MIFTALPFITSSRFNYTPLALSLLALHLPAMADTALTQDAGLAAQALPEVSVTASPANAEKAYAPALTTVGGKTAAALRDVPQTITVVDRAVMDDQAVASLTEALRNVPGITISAGEGGQIGDNINLRGYSARTDVYLDGFRDRGQYSRDTFALDAVEVLKGPASMLFGRGSTGGVINQVSKKPDLETRGQVGLSVGSDDYYRSTFDHNQRLTETSALRVAGFGQDIQSTREVTEKKDFGVAPSVRFGIGTPTEVLVSALIQRNRDIPDYGFPLYRGAQTTPQTPGRPVAANPDNYYGFTDDYFDQDIDILSLSLTHRFNTVLKLQSRVQYGHYQTKAAPTTLTLPASTTPATPLNNVNAVRDRKDRELDDSSLFNQTDLLLTFATGSLQHKLTTGVEVGRDTYENQGYKWAGIPSVNIAQPVYIAMPATAVRSKSPTRTDNTADSLAFYVNEELALNPQLKMVAGLRWNRYELSADTITNATGATTSLGRVDKMSSVRGGFIWQPDTQQSYYVSYGTSFNPSGETLTLSSGNANVDPEQSVSYEVGAKYALLDDALQIGTALFRVNKENARTTDTVTQITTLDGRTQVQGVELSVAGKLAERWQVLAGYTFLDSETLASKDRRNVGSSTVPIYDLYAQGNELANVPRHSATLWTTYGITPHWEVGGGALYSTDRFVDNYEASVIDGYTRYDASVAFLQKRYDIRLNLQNLTDARYFEASSSARATPAKGRGAIMTVSYRY